MDIQGAYQNISQDDGVNILKKALEERDDKQIPIEFISKLMELVLKYNIFEFHGALYQQLIGTAMGSKPAPSYANIYLSKTIDPEVEKLGFKYGENKTTAFSLFKRFLDDIFIIYKGTTTKLHELLKEINEIHPTLKFTVCYNSKF